MPTVLTPQLDGQQDLSLGPIRLRSIGSVYSVRNKNKRGVAPLNRHFNKSPFPTRIVQNQEPRRLNPLPRAIVMPFPLRLRDKSTREDGGNGHFTER